MCLLTMWEHGDALGCHVCLLLDPADWRALGAAQRSLSRRLDEREARRLFRRRLQDRVSASAGLGRTPAPEDPALASLEPVLALASAVDTVAGVLEDVSAHPRLAETGAVPVFQALKRLHHLALRDRQLMPRERNPRRSPLLRRILRGFASLRGLMPALVSLLGVFPADVMSSGLFVTICEVLVSLIHNTKESKKVFVQSGGLQVLLEQLRAHPDDAAMQAAGLAALLALSARSVLCIRLMADAGVHEVVTTALQRFSADTKVVARATGLLANMSNVACVCPALKRCGVLALAQKLLGHEEHRSSLFVQDLVRYLMDNLEHYEHNREHYEHNRERGDWHSREIPPELGWPPRPEREREGDQR